MDGQTIKLCATNNSRMYFQSVFSLSLNKGELSSPAIRSTALSAGSSTDLPWIFLLDRSCLGRFQGKVSPGAGDADPDLKLQSSSSETSAEEDMEQWREGFPELELWQTKENQRSLDKMRTNGADQMFLSQWHISVRKERAR